MYARLAISVVLFIVSTGSLFAKDNHTSVRVGDLVVVKMTGDAAKEYATRRGIPKQGNVDARGVTISTMATIAQFRPDGKYRIECSTPVEKDKNPPRMLTLTAIVDAKQLKSEVTPKNTPVYASPAEAQNGKRPTLTTTEGKLLHVELSDLRSAKLQTWALVDEVGN
jgi:hypothetical protein